MEKMKQLRMGSAHKAKKKNLRTLEDLSKTPLLYQVNLFLPLEAVQFWLSYSFILRLINSAHCFVNSI